MGINLKVGGGLPVPTIKPAPRLFQRCPWTLSPGMEGGGATAAKANSRHRHFLVDSPPPSLISWWDNLKRSGSDRWSGALTSGPVLRRRDPGHQPIACTWLNSESQLMVTRHRVLYGWNSTNGPEVPCNLVASPIEQELASLHRDLSRSRDKANSPPPPVSTGVGAIRGKVCDDGGAHSRPAIADLEPLNEVSHIWVGIILAVHSRPSGRQR
jgi:hypothetical protein